jgi:hypothetical protein
MARKLTALLMLGAFLLLPLESAATTWTKVRYNGGAVQTKVDPKDWNNQFTVTPDLISFVLNDGQKVDITPRAVTELTYGQEAHRHVALMASLGILITPLALFGLFHKQRLHFIGVEYAGPDSTRGGLLLQGANENYRQILFSLKSVTGKTVQASADDAKYMNP